MDTMELKPFYMNLVLLNGSSVVKSHVQDKAGKGVFGKLVGGAAAKVVSDEAILEKLTLQLEEKLGTVTENLGLSLNFEKVYNRKSVTVYRVSVVEINKDVLLSNTKGEKFATAYQTLLDTMVDLGLGDKLQAVDEKLHKVVQKKLMDNLESQIPTKLGDQGIECSVDVFTSEEQADYFFSMLSQIK